MAGTLYGIGVGPGDPDYLTLKAIKCMEKVDIIAAPGKVVEETTAYKIAVQAAPFIEEKEKAPIFMPMVMDRAKMEDAHRDGAAAVIKLLEEGKDVGFLTLGDTTIYGDKEFNRLKGYLTNVVRSYVELSVDCYLAAKKNPQAMRKFGTFLGHYDYCLDGRATELAEFAMKNLPEISAPAVNAAPGAPEEPEDELRIPPDKIPDHTEKTRLDDCLYKEIYAVKAALPKAKSWEDIAGAIKKRMVGLTRPIATLDNNGSIVPLMENGSPVVRKVTAEDIDRIGPACCDITCVF